MKYRSLGGTGLEVSEIGFGTWGIGGLSHGPTSYGSTNDEESKLALRLAFDLGVTFYDTADIYGYGHSEKLIGQTLKNVRQKIVIASKFGFLKHNGAQDFSLKHLKASVELSMQRLQTDYIDLYQLHNPPIDLLERNDNIFSALGSLQQQGKIRAIGISVRSPDDGLAAIKKFGIKSIQVNFNLVDQRALENGLLDLAKQKNVGIIARTPLCFGFLTGKYSGISNFDSSDHRSTWPPEQIWLWANAHQLFSSVLTKTEGQNSAQIALRFCLSYRSVSTVIPGMMVRDEVRANVFASQLALFSEEELLKLNEVYKNNTVFLGAKSTRG